MIFGSPYGHQILGRDHETIVYLHPASHKFNFCKQEIVKILSTLSTCTSTQLKTTKIMLILELCIYIRVSLH
jgi:hypothetical protein